MLKFIKATPSDAELIATIAKPIWEEHYTPIIGKAQVDYMLANLQNTSSIRRQIEEHMEYFIIESDQCNAGYLAIQQKQQKLFISKFYLASAFRGRGIARLMLEKIHTIAAQKNCSSLELTINKYNPTLEIYLKLGFKIEESITIDIGGGYIMDDYRMSKSLT